MTTTDLLEHLARGGRARLIVVAAHPDDETIGLGGLLHGLRDATVVHVTDGAPRDGADAARHGLTAAGYAALRRQEALAALAIAGIAEARSFALGLPDQEVARHLVALARGLAAFVAEQRPDLVVTHAYEGGHPDHDAVAFAVRAALREQSVPLAEMTGYHAGPEGWEIGRFLPPADTAIRVPLDAATVAAKRRMLDCYASQREVLSLFAPGDELLRPAPPADFTQPPHPGPLLHERYGWGPGGAGFRRLAAAAQAELGFA